MFFRKCFYLIGLLMFVFSMDTNGQIIYFNTTSNSFYTLNVETCQTTFVANGQAYNDMAITPAGLIYGLVGNQIWVTNPGAGTTTLVGSLTGIVVSPSLEYGPDGFLYVVDIVPPRTLARFNPANGTTQILGNLPSSWNAQGDILYFDGQYYGTFTTSSGSALTQINTANPGASTIVSPTPMGNLVAGGGIQNATCPRMYWFNNTSGPSDVWQYDVNSDTWTQICPGFSFVVGGADTPTGYSFPLNCGGCTTNAGIVTSQSYTRCGTLATVTVPFTGGQVLDSDDVLRYILFTNLSNPTGSIIQQSASPTFSFNSSLMQFGVTYYLGTIAGNNAGGQVSLSDPCLDVSTGFAQVIWRPNPTVSFSTANPSVCAGDCRAFTVNLTGTPPFSLTYSTPFGGNQIQTFNSTTGSIQLCPPGGASPGNATLQAVSLSDAYCICP